jgi:KipI family sensor histidine kinase inhibitor
VEIYRSGSRAVLVEVSDDESVLELYDDLCRTPPAGTVDLVPADRTILITYAPGSTDHQRISADVTARRPRQGRVLRGPTVDVRVRYDGQDLAEVAELTGLSEDEIVRRHLACEHVVAFCGFAAGFPYIAGLDRALRVPRRSSPRLAVDPGAIAIADKFTGIYPRAMPGGWRIIGHTDDALWDASRNPPTSLGPGTRIRFRREAA